MGQHGGGLGTELRQQPPRRLRADTLPHGRPYGENLFGGGGSSWTARDAVKSWVDEKQYYNHGSNSCCAGEGVRALHTGGVAQHQIHRMCPRHLQQRRHLHHLQLQPTGQLHRTTALLDP
ncbi:hypothetical protein PR202_gb12169 [Eleusine coracana subsp. coracana]|uniref:Uncharacterized protein n=1 Tax=Eleusine coracana subsp. coracana TaxID=191504 RepID=A0AAV5EPC4_ELECO|nr:hypothetical protein PR202_gb12169 [Eleusine coracana subsp. coracana]